MPGGLGKARQASKLACLFFCVCDPDKEFPGEGWRVSEVRMGFPQIGRLWGDVLYKGLMHWSGWRPRG